MSLICTHVWESSNLPPFDLAFDNLTIKLQDHIRITCSLQVHKKFNPMKVVKINVLGWLKFYKVNHKTFIIEIEQANSQIN